MTDQNPPDLHVEPNGNLDVPRHKGITIASVERGVLLTLHSDGSVETGSLDDAAEAGRVFVESLSDHLRAMFNDTLDGRLSEIARAQLQHRSDNPDAVGQVVRTLQQALRDALLALETLPV